jgi:L,D-peptidoglycan transpeptidase YkuD (ErfK/YbiS/YcfS/YnhG family)
LVLVTAATMDTVTARLQRFERAAPGEPWRALGPGEPAVVGKSGLAWSRFFRALARRGEPIKVEGDRRTPAGIYRLGRSFGIEASTRPGYLHVKDDTVCVDDAASPAYNTITVRASIGPKVHAETMSRAPSTYRRGIVIDYPTDARARAGSCIFVHVWRNSSSGTAGCVALPQQRVEALQDFTASPDTAIAILPRDALARLPGCLPAATP